MGDSQLPTGISETFDFMSQRIQRSFGSTEEMKTYYLQMYSNSAFMRKYGSKEAEYAGLKKLSERLKQYAVFIQTLAERKWEKGVASTQHILGLYLMQNTIDGNERRSAHSEVTSLLQFIVFLADNSSLTKQLQGALNYHLSNVTYLLKSMSVPVEQE